MIHSGFINILLFIVLLFILTFRIEYFTKSPCDDLLTNKEYLQHMIPHHQVAVDISLRLQKITKNPVMQEILRKLIWVQNYEINLMKKIMKNLPENDMSDNKITMNKTYIPNKSDFIYPNKVSISDTYCDPQFFDPKKHMEHMEHMKLTDKMYIEHMIPHHQVAVDMSKKLLKHTQSDFMIQLSYRIIRSQQDELILLNDLLSKKNYVYESNLVI
jgi:uncharacterized protein (DUF305 family)